MRVESSTTKVLYKCRNSEVTVLQICIDSRIGQAFLWVKKEKKEKKKAFIDHTSWPNIKWDIKRMTTTLQTMEPFQS